ncbi:5-amino-6-(5-phospho-D-ribitylamino)uracil phosphatase YigB [Polaromonas vacuolata]|uniref:5-amino-6-(5-phospho-D-ribitylamino)uracil phosphatase YigB n=1 Tax=Polaromonas vacuolata TaxID=37448 RepID=A0A6H2HBF6_9BURK|nr:HAD-IA family hydrolase [Polaromonas vacuolata]QJC57160.1 5-amino-6-(5-phospho-D-ribitylamino)uracil phosphatase YigB [Polaromonas vacuolata]
MLNFKSIQAISIDLDDTLWPVWPAIERAEIALDNWLREHAPATAVLFADTNERAAMREHINRSRPELTHNLSAQRRETIRLALERSAENTALAEPAFDIFFAGRNRVDLFADALPALVFLAARYPVVALSNGNADIERIGLGQYFHASISAQQFGVAKPDARIFHAAAEAAGVDAARVLHIGDDALMDVLGALDCGMQTVWVNREGKDWVHAQQPHLSVVELNALCVLMAAA